MVTTTRGSHSPDLAHLNLIGISPAFKSAIDRIQRIAQCDAAALIEGETGTGKELAARAIHYLGERRSAPFIPVNCGAIPDALLENELFGHARGAFTDAREAVKGVVADAQSGTLFLDEVEALSPKAQVTLLRLIQEGTYRPLGARHLIQSNIRIVAASNASLTQHAAQNRFRWDLLHRLRIMTLEMPPLRERSGDALLLAQHFIRRFASQYKQPEKMLDEQAMVVLSRYAWPGNVRELENLIHRELLLSDGPLLRIRSSDLLGPQPTYPDAGDGALEQSSFTVGFARAKVQAIERFERLYLHWALSRSQGNVSQAARLCGKERRTLGKLLKKHGIDKGQYLS